MAIVRFEENQQKVFEDIAKEIVAKIQRQLRIEKKVSSGNLVESFKYDVGEGFVRIYSTASYANAVDKGRGPTINEQPEYDPSVRQSVENWMMDKSINARRKDKDGRTIGFAPAASGGYLRASAFAIAKKIHEEGIKGIGFTDFAMSGFKDQITRDVGEAYYRDIKEMIDTNLERMVRAKKNTP